MKQKILQFVEDHTIALFVIAVLAIGFLTGSIQFKFQFIGGTW